VRSRSLVGKESPHMRRLTNSSKFIWLSTITLLLAATASYVLSNIKHPELSLSTHINPANKHISISKTKDITYRGISFNYDALLAYEIKAETKPAYALQEKTDTGQGVVPEHIAFSFVGTYASQHESSFFSPGITVYPIAEYKKALSKSRSYVQQFEDEIQKLRALLSEQSDVKEDTIPFLPFEVGASQRFHAGVKYVNFKNGKGVFFLTQYNIEPALVNNEGLTYTFQGITDDNVYYVSAIFPVTAPFLPESYEDESSEDYALIIPTSFRRHEYETFEKNYKIYLDKVIKKLERLPSDSFQPKLTILEDLIRSLEVRVS
jgi:hypothetical protein